MVQCPPFDVGLKGGHDGIVAAQPVIVGLL